jgi:hypothetical protein
LHVVYALNQHLSASDTLGNVLKSADVRFAFVPRERQIFPTALRAGMEEGLIDKIVSDK